MQDSTKQKNRGGRPRKFDEDEALDKMRRQLWTTGLSGTSIEGIARAAGINRPSLAAAFGDRDAIYARAATEYGTMVEQQLSQALADDDLKSALNQAFAAAMNIYAGDGPSGCFITSTAPAEALTNPVCRHILAQTVFEIDALFLKRLEQERNTGSADLPLLAAQLGATLHSLSLRSRAGWSSDRLESFAAGSVKQVLAALGRSGER